MRRLGKKKNAPLLGSSRGWFFKEPGSSKRLSFMARRSQKIKVRHRYVATMVKDTGRVIWMWVKLGLASAAVVWLAILLVHFWNSSPLLRVKEIKFYGDVPKQLPAAFSLKPGQNVVFMNTFREEKNILREFPELKAISVWRTPMRAVVVRGEYRAPMALAEKEGRTVGIDAAGFIFPITAENQPKESLPWVSGIKRGNLPDLMAALVRLKKEAPDFSSLIFRLETDTMNNLDFELRDQIFVWWGQLEEKNLVDKAERVQEVLARFTAKKKPATLRFVTENRLVIDSNWMAKDDEKI